MHGRLLSEKKNQVDLKAQEVVLLSKINLPKNSNEVFFLKLQLTDQNKVLDENLYWLSNKPHSFEKLNELGKITLNSGINKIDEGHFALSISNPNNETAFFIRLKIMDSKNDLVLPVFFTDNYFTLFPGEEKKVELDLTLKNIPDNYKIKLVVEGWNIIQEEKEL
jgi:hypothetical protein